MARRPFDYEFFRDALYRDIRDFEAYNEVLSSYTEIMLTPELLTSLVPTEKVSILVMVKNSLIVYIYTLLRRILSSNENDVSLINFYIELNGIDRAKLKNIKSICTILKEKVFPCIENKNEYEELMEKVLPNSILHYRNFKKLANKKIFHKDKEHLIKEIPSHDTQLIFKDLKDTFNDLVLKKENTSYTFDALGAKKLSNMLFNSCTKGIKIGVDERKKCLDTLLK